MCTLQCRLESCSNDTDVYTILNILGVLTTAKCGLVLVDEFDKARSGIGDCLLEVVKEYTSVLYCTVV